MKKLLKLVVSLFICGLMLLSGCGTASTSLSSNFQSTVGQVSSINILARNFFTADSENAEQYKEDWLEEIYFRYGVELNITSCFYTDGVYDNTVLDQIKDVLYDDDEFAGLIEVSSSQILSSTIDQLLPLDDYLADNAIWQSLPDELKNTFKVDGQIYAIPTYMFRAQNARIITDEALEETGITVTDLQSFSDFAKAYTQSTGKTAITSYYMLGLTDILNAFGLYKYQIISPLSYDPTEDCCVDFLTKDAAVDALEYLRELYQAGALNINFSDSKIAYTDFNAGISCTSYFQYFDYENCTELFTLNPEYPQLALTTTRGFAMTKGTPQPKETINQFINMLFGSEDCYLECWLGSSDHYVLNSDGTITVKMPQNADGSYTYPPMPNLTGGLTDIFPYSDANIFFSPNGVIDEEAKAEADEYNDRFTLLYDSFKKGIIVEVPALYSATISKEINTAVNNDLYIQTLYMSCIKSAITSTKYTVREVVDGYREEMLNMGGNALLDKINAAIGKETAYYYG
ncbi:MAG TPA: ABC transporter substrate-binding protein [Oscillospiraceae bacterium]|nr:ABC transporter substrate-binding protein [Oscillospiraceae bacterium]HPF56039.1 ABC transporter substrate-binding protein [Clostridiales bacterium]HPK35036.1 ABC transporter substrate-binding protein [Oscillospiraceae bacterium]HPR76673.1 ABC transporter substrate-binding protein [Oscillospiraceae bacterium]